MRENIKSKEKNTSANTQNKRSIGSIWERFAGSRLMESGLEIITYNFRCRQGEIDIVARDGEYLVFVEVKCRKNKNNGNPLEAVTLYKQRTIRRVADFFLMRYGFKNDTPCRFDVFGIEVRGSKDDVEELWIKNAF